MTVNPKVEVFNAGCPARGEAVALVHRLACPSCDLDVLDMKDTEVAKRAEVLGVRSVLAVAINGQFAGCRAERRTDEQTLRATGSGQA